MSEIVLATLNAKFIHCAFGLRCLAANMGELRERTAILEFDINTRPADVAEAILKHNPRVLGLGVYIWNAAQTRSLVRILKCVRPEMAIVLGGPEVSHETEGQPIVELSDYVICGEAELAFVELCRALIAGSPPPGKVVRPALPDLGQVRLPYDLYTDADLSGRVVYVEASRGCPFSCEFCLSSLDTPVRQFPREAFLAAIEKLLSRGAGQLKFVDRTFNLHIESSLAILNFLHERHRPGLFFHFEVVPDRLPPALLEALARFPAGTVQLEAGVQTFNEEVAARISRRQDYARVEENLRRLRAETGAHIHADLIAGLPGEDLESFGAGFDRLVSLGPHEIQVGILKRLKGAPIARHGEEWGMVYHPEPPFEILKNKSLTFDEIQRLKRFARYWDLTGNSGNFVETTPLIWSAPSSSPFERFMAFSDWLQARLGRTDAIALPRLVEALHQWLTGENGLDAATTALSLARDYLRPGRREIPECLRRFNPPVISESRRAAARLPKRQARHLAG